MTTIAVLSAGLSVPSSTRLLADRIAAATAEALEEVSLEVVELRPLAHALADHLVTGFPTGELAEAIETVRRADGLIVVTPVFAASYSGLFKTFFDVLEDGLLDGKPVLVAATAGTGRRAGRAGRQGRPERPPCADRRGGVRRADAVRGVAAAGRGGLRPRLSAGRSRG
jgi:FMN reductase